jgi:predicted metal-binding protein
LKVSQLSSTGRDRISVRDADLEKYCALAIKAGVTHARQIDPSSVVTASWVRLKCQFGCHRYGGGYCCPPYTPTPEETRAVVDSYRRAILFHMEISDTPEREKISRKCLDALLELEGTMFKDGFYKALIFVAGPCYLCKKCGVSENKPCQFPRKARPSMEGCGIDVFQTARNNGFFIQTLRERTETTNRYCLMMVD